jgi:hypothetical protein
MGDGKSKYAVEKDKNDGLGERRKSNGGRRVEKQIWDNY